MKILKTLLLILVVLILALLLIGLVKPHVNYGHTITVNKPVKEAWAVSQDESKYSQWLEGFQDMELLSGQKGKAGSTYKVVVKPAPDQPEFVMTETLKDIKENEYVDMHFNSDVMDFEQKIYFTESNGTTTIKSDSKVIGKNIMMKSMFALMEMFTGSFTKQEAKNFDALKVLIDDNKTNYFQSDNMIRIPVTVGGNSNN